MARRNPYPKAPDDSEDSDFEAPSGLDAQEAAADIQKNATLTAQKKLPEITARLSTLSERLFMLDGKPFSLEDYPMHRAVYDGRYKRTVMCCGRQVAKSTSLSSFIVAESVCTPFFRQYYVSPTKEQTLTFSNLRVGALIRQSPVIKDYFQSPESADRVLFRGYTNGSINAFTYAKTNADRARGFSADRCSFDEAQDIILTDVAPVVNAAMKNSKYRFETYVGTPKTMENPLQLLWEDSSQSEWAMKCDGCSKHTIVVDHRAIGKHGPICLNCGKGLNPRLGFWVDTVKPPPGKTEHAFKGFHIPQPIIPTNIVACVKNTEDNPNATEDAESRWADIIHDMETMSASRFRNEVLGVSDAKGARLISLEEIESLCTQHPLSPVPTPALKEGLLYTYAGADWSGDGTSGYSRTVLWIWGWNPSTQKLRCLFYKVYSGIHAEDAVPEMARICQDWKVTLFVGDAGAGAMQNGTMRQHLGAHRVTQVQYGSQKEALTWNGMDRHQADRTTVIDNYLLMLKRGAVEYGRREEMKTAIDDVMNVFEEVTSSGKKVWRHAPTRPDDCLHAQVFGWLAWKIATNDVKFYT